MAYVSLPQPDLEANRDLLIPMPDLLSNLTSKIGKKLTAYVAGVDDVKTIKSWIPDSDLIGEEYLRKQRIVELHRKRRFAEPRA
jgi:hypothetical protein